ncbi:MAG: polyphosphate--AMP phosphotransferase [Eggerthellaceae bacterium]|nr:polyphosphate--AMP phosphotransferase [Eggerthellaceae bacterium]
MLEQIDFSKEKMSRDEYKPLQKELIGKLVMLQQKARAAGVGLVVLFEGWGGAGKGSRISDLMYELDARATSVHVTRDFDYDAAASFVGREWGVTDFKPVMQEFWQSLGERGTITFYDRGWYTAAISQAMFELSQRDPEAVEMFAKSAKAGSGIEDAASKARGEFHRDVVASYQRIAHDFEQMLVDDGYIVIKLFVHVSKEAQRKRLKRLRENPNTAWRVSDAKLAEIKYYDQAYILYDRLLENSNFAFAPWTLINGEDRRSANIQIAQALVDAIEGALASGPDKAAEEAQAKAAANSARAAAAIAEGGAEGKVVDDAEAVLAAANAEAMLQKSQAPRSSKYIIMAGYPEIDHTKEKPCIASDEEYKEQLKIEQQRFNDLEMEMFQKRVPLMLMYEGWDAAGKGGNIKRVAQAIDARAYTVYPSPAPTRPELMHPHLWRYWTKLPKAGHVGIYDRSWYGRVLVERVEGFASPEQWSRAYDEINSFEYEMVQWGAILLKFWVDITPEEQLRRFEARQIDPTKVWKITEEDWRNRDKYPQYKQAVNDMFRLTSTTFAPWILLESDDKKYARIQALRAINEALEGRLHRDK